VLDFHPGVSYLLMFASHFTPFLVCSVHPLFCPLSPFFSGLSPLSWFLTGLNWWLPFFVCQVLLTFSPSTCRLRHYPTVYTSYYLQLL